MSEEKKVQMTLVNPQISMIVCVILFVLFYNFDGYDIDLYDAIIAALTF